jgi:hypothetical protein
MLQNFISKRAKILPPKLGTFDPFRPAPWNDIFWRSHWPEPLPRLELAVEVQNLCSVSLERNEGLSVWLVVIFPFQILPLTLTEFMTSQPTDIPISVQLLVFSIKRQ